MATRSSFLALGEALKTVPRAGACSCAGLEGARQRAHDPRVGRYAFSIGRSLDRGLERLREAQCDPGALVVARGCRLDGIVGLGYEDELRFTAHQPHLDVAPGQLTVDVERRLTEQVEQAQVQRRAERLPHPARRFGRRLVPA